MFHVSRLATRAINRRLKQYEMDLFTSDNASWRIKSRIYTQNCAEHIRFLHIIIMFPLHFMSSTTRGLLIMHFPKRERVYWKLIYYFRYWNAWPQHFNCLHIWSAGIFRYKICSELQSLSLSQSWRFTMVLCGAVFMKLVIVAELNNMPLTHLDYCIGFYVCQLRLIMQYIIYVGWLLDIYTSKTCCIWSTMYGSVR